MCGFRGGRSPLGIPCCETRHHQGPAATATSPPSPTHTPPSGGGGLTRASTLAQAPPAIRSSDRAVPRPCSSSAVLTAARPPATWSLLPSRPSPACLPAWSAVTVRRAWVARRAARRWSGCARRARCAATVCCACAMCMCTHSPAQPPNRPHPPVRPGASPLRAPLLRPSGTAHATHREQPRRARRLGPQLLASQRACGVSNAPAWRRRHSPPLGLPDGGRLALGCPPHSARAPRETGVFAAAPRSRI